VNRELFRPKTQSLSEQCPSCPFREGNEKEFGEIVQRLKAAQGPNPDLASEEHARAVICGEVRHRGDFLCHNTVYDAEMNFRPPGQRRQCPGATAFYKAADPHASKAKSEPAKG
jgi:hypothetical protein